MALKKLREANVEDVVTEHDPESFVVHGYDLRKLDKLKPYDPNEPLPAAVIKADKKGRPVLVKKGEPRYYFDPTRTELIRVYRGVAKKTELAWKYRRNTEEPQKTEQNDAIRDYLIRVKKMPVRGDHF